MTRPGFFIALVCAGALAGGAAPARAHSVKACISQIRTYQMLCKFSPTARLAGMCVVEETLKHCADPKRHHEMHGSGEKPPPRARK